MKIETATPGLLSHELNHGTVYQREGQYFIAGPQGVTNLYNGHLIKHEALVGWRFQYVNNAKLLVG